MLLCSVRLAGTQMVRLSSHFCLTALLRNPRAAPRAALAAGVMRPSARRVHAPPSSRSKRPVHPCCLMSAHAHRHGGAPAAAIFAAALLHAVAKTLVFTNSRASPFWFQPSPPPQPTSQSEMSRVRGRVKTFATVLEGVHLSPSPTPARRRVASPVK